jgi:histidinol-phosphate aminotransferase
LINQNTNLTLDNNQTVLSMTAMLPFLRADLAALTAYTPHPGGDDTPTPLDQLDTNENPLDLPAPLKATLAQQYQQMIAANRYPDGSHSPLKQAIAEYATETAGPSGTLVHPPQISVGNGSDELIRSLLIATCLGNQGSILIAQPTFSMYAILARTLGIPVVSVERSDATFEVDLRAAQATMVSPQSPPVRVIFMVHPNSPTANPLSESELAWLRSQPETVLIVVDEAYFEFSQQTTVTDALTRPNWVVLRTFSKAFRLAAHRVGYAIAQPPLITALEKVRLPYNLPSFSQAAALMALTYRQELLGMLPTLLQSRDHLVTALMQNPCLQVWPTQANFIYLRLTDTGLKTLAAQDQGTGLETLFKAMRRQGSLIRHTGGGLRITVGTPAENQRTLKHLETSLKGKVLS